MPPSKKKDPPEFDDMSIDSSRANGGKSAPKTATAKSSSSSNTGKEVASRKSARKPAPKSDPSSNKVKQKRKGDSRSSSPTPAYAAASSKKKKKKKRSSYAGTEDDSSDEEYKGSRKEYPELPEIGDEIAIKCPPDPPYPEGWYTGVVADVVVHDDDDLGGYSSKPRSKSKKKKRAHQNFTVNIEWDGGGEEAIQNPEWRMKGDAPDKHGRVSHRDAKLRPYFKYWVNRLQSMHESEKKLSRTRAGKNTRVDPDQKTEWIQCSNPSCGKWRAIPPFMKSSAILESCDNKWFCVLNSWDEAIASCGAPQETGYMSK